MYCTVQYYVLVSMNGQWFFWLSTPDLISKLVGLSPVSYYSQSAHLKVRAHFPKRRRTYRPALKQVLHNTQLDIPDQRRLLLIGSALHRRERHSQGNIGQTALTSSTQLFQPSELHRGQAWHRPHHLIDVLSDITVQCSYSTNNTNLCSETS